MSNLSRPLAFTAAPTPLRSLYGGLTQKIYARGVPDGGCCSEFHSVLVLFTLQARFHLLFLLGVKKTRTQGSGVYRVKPLQHGGSDDRQGVKAPANRRDARVPCAHAVLGHAG